MNRKQHQKPFYRRPWLWIVVALLLVGGGWFISNHNQAQKLKEIQSLKQPQNQIRRKSRQKNLRIKGKIVLLLNLPVIVIINQRTR